MADPPPQPPDLTMDILTNEILPKLPIKSLTRFKTISKTFNSLISSPLFFHLYFPHLSPSLLLSGSRFISSFPLSPPSPSPPSTFTFRRDPITLLGSCNGIILLDRSYSSYMPLMLLNPFTRIYLDISTSSVTRHCPDVVNFGICFDDVVGKDFKIVAVSDSHTRARPGNSSVKTRDVRVYSVKTGSWKLLDRCFPDDAMEKRYGGALVGNHLLHWMFWCPSKFKRRMGCFDVRVGKWVDDVPLPDCYYYDGNAKKNYLLDFGVVNGRLFCLMESKFDARFDVWVMEEYGVKESWAVLLSVPLSDDLQGGVVPIAFRKDGKEVLIRQRHKKRLMWFDRESGGIRPAEFSPIPDFSSLLAYVCDGSFASVPGGKLFGDVYVDPDERRL